MIHALLFWDIIFSDSVPGVLVNACMTRPLDWGTASFYASRRELIDARLQLISQNLDRQLVEMRTAYDTLHGCMMVGGHWDQYGIDELCAIAACVGGARLAPLCRHLPEHQSGMPDLLLYKKEDDGGGKVMLVEVKGPGDSLMDNQLVWLDKLREIGVETRVCLVAVTADAGATRGGPPVAPAAVE